MAKPTLMDITKDELKETITEAVIAAFDYYFQAQGLNRINQIEAMLAQQNANNN